MNSIPSYDNLLVEPELIFQNCFVCHRLLGVVLLGIFELLMCNGQGRETAQKKRKWRCTKGKSDEKMFLHILADVG